MLEKQRHHNVAKTLGKIATLIGEVQGTSVVLDSSKSVVPGLGLTVLADGLLDRIAWLEGGCLRLAVVGPVSRGKSTLVNALLGASRLPVDMEACTGVITQVVYGSNADEVTVVENGERRTLSQDEFRNTIRLTPEEQDLLKNNGALGPEGLIKIDYAVLESEHPFSEQGLHIVDTLGFRVGRKAEEITKAFLAKTDALVFVTRAQPLFEEEDQAFLETQLRLNVSRLEHIFFVINDFNGLDESERAEVMANAQLRLADYFCTVTGEFDEELFERRVFIVNARDALKAKLEAADADALQATGLPALEHAIQEMLNDEELLSTVLEAMMVQVLIPTLDEAGQIIQQEKLLLSKDLSELEHMHQEIAERLTELTKQTHDILDMLDVFSQRIAERAADHFEGYITRMMDQWKDVWNTWDIQFTKDDIISGVRKGNKAAFAAKVEDMLRPCFAMEMSKWESEVLKHLEPDMEELSTALEEQTHRFVDGLGKVQASMVDQATLESLYLDQELIRQKLLRRVISTFVGTLDSNLISEKELVDLSVRKIIWHTFLSVLPVLPAGISIGIYVAAAVAALMGVIPVPAALFAALPMALIKDLDIGWERPSLGPSFPKGVVNSMRNTIGRTLREALSNSMSTMKSNISTAISDHFKVSARKFHSVLQAEIEQVRGQLEQTVSKKRTGEAQVTFELSRLGAVAEHLTRLFEQVSREVYGRVLTPEEYQHLRQGNALLSRTPNTLSVGMGTGGSVDSI